MVIFSEQEHNAIANLAIDRALASLSPYERFLAFQALKGYKPRELADMFETSRQSISNTLLRMRKKVGVILGI